MTLSPAQLEALISGGESSTVEFKQAFPAQARDLAHEVAALATSGGGFVVLGITDGGAIVGLEGVEGSAAQAAFRDRLEGAFRAIQPALTAHITFFHISSTICLVEVPAGIEPPYWVDGRAYVRVGTESRPATPEEVRDIIRRHDGRNARDANQGLVAELTRLARDLRAAVSNRGPRVYFLGSDDPPHVTARYKAEDAAVDDAESRVRAFIEASVSAYLNDWDGAQNSADQLAVIDTAIREIRARG